MKNKEIKEMLVEADKASTFAGELYKKLLPAIKGTVSAFLIQVLFDDDKLKYKRIDEQYRQDKTKLAAEELETYRLYSKSAMGISRAKKADEIETDLQMYFFLEFKLKGASTEDANKKATEAVASIKPADQKQVVEEVKKTGKKASEVLTDVSKKESKGKVLHKSKSTVEVEKYIEQATEEAVLKALINKARKGNHVELARILELALPLTQVSVPVADKTPTTTDVKEEIEDLNW